MVDRFRVSHPESLISLATWYSRAAGLPDWQLKLFLALSERGFVYPLVPWGDAE